MSIRQSPVPSSLLLAGAILTVYLRVCGFEFVSYDDGYNIYNNWRVTSFSADNLLHFWKAPYENLYIPLTYNLWAFLAVLSGMFGDGPGGVLDPAVFHAANLIFHLGGALAVFAILRRLVVDVWAAWAGALVFALHPVQVEAVVWVTGLKDVFSAFWALLAIWQYLLYVEHHTLGPPERRQALVHYALVGLCFALAILAKPGTVVLPLLLAVVGRFRLGREWRALAVEIAPFVVLSLPVILMTKSAQPDTSQAWQPEPWQRLLVLGDAVSFYCYKVLAPFILGPDYGRTPRWVLGQDWLYLTALPPLVALPFRCWIRKAGPWLTAVDIFVLSLLPVLGLISFDFQNISTVADRYLYLAMLGPGLAVAWALSRRRSRGAWLVFSLAVALLAAKTVVQTDHWRNSSRLAGHALTVNPRSWVMHNNLGIELAKSQRHDEAIDAFGQALVANPEYAEAYNNLGALYREMGKHPEAIANFHKALAVNPKDAKAAFNLAMAYESRNQPLRAIDYYRQAIAAKPDFLEAYNNLGLILLGLNRKEAALDLFLTAAAACPEHPRLHFNLARAYAEFGRRQESIAELKRATDIDPEFMPAYHQLYHAYLEAGEEKTALAYRDRAVDCGFDPDSCALCRDDEGIR